MTLAVTGEYSADWGSEDDELKACKGYCSSGYNKRVWCDELPASSQSGNASSFPLVGVIIGCVVVAVAVAVVVVVCLCRGQQVQTSMVNGATPIVL
jgi:hypothetical protein